MFIKFQSKAYRDLSFFEPVGLKLLELMGEKPLVPGALTAKELPAALLSLEKKLNREEAEDEEEVSLATRAVPLIELLKAAIEEDCSVLWVRSKSI